MKTKSGKSHWECKTLKITDRWGEERDDHMVFVAFDGKKHMDAIKKRYMAHGVYFEYSDLRCLD